MLNIKNNNKEYLASDFNNLMDKMTIPEKQRMFELLKDLYFAQTSMLKNLGFTEFEIDQLICGNQDAESIIAKRISVEYNFPLETVKMFFQNPHAFQLKQIDPAIV